MTEIDQSQRIQTTKERNLAQSENKCRQACVKNVRSLLHYERIGHLPNGAILSNASLRPFTFLATRKQLLNLANGRNDPKHFVFSLYSLIKLLFFRLFNSKLSLETFKCHQEPMRRSMQLPY